MSSQADNSKPSSKNNSNAAGSPRSFRSSRLNSANSKDSWLSIKKTNNTFKTHSIDKTLKKIDQTFEKDSVFIQQLEQKPHERDVCRKQAAELLNKRWNDEVYIPTQTSIQKTMDSNSDRYSDKLQQQYAHYLNHNNISDGNVFLDVFDENSVDNMDYQPLKCQSIQANILKPTAVDIKDPLKIQYKSRYAKALDVNKSTSEYSIGKNTNTTKFWSKLVKESSHIENAENVRRRKRIKISDFNRQSQLHWGSSA